MRYDDAYKTHVCMGDSRFQKIVTELVGYPLPLGPHHLQTGFMS